MSNLPGSVTTRRAPAAAGTGELLCRVRCGFMAVFYLLLAATGHQPQVAQAARQQQERRGPGVENPQTAARTREPECDEVGERPHRQTETTHVHAPGQRAPVPRVPRQEDGGGHVADELRQPRGGEVQVVSM